MAKLIKFSGYYVDMYDAFDEEEFARNMKRYLDVEFLKVKSVNVGEWTDEHALNYADCPEEIYQEYFDKEE